VAAAASLVKKAAHMLGFVLFTKRPSRGTTESRPSSTQGIATMRHGRTTTILLTFLLALGAPVSALADPGAGETSAKAPTDVAAPADSKPAEGTAAPAPDTKAPVDTATKPPADTAAPTTEEPATTTDVPQTPTAPEVPAEPEAPTVPQTPNSPDVVPDDVDAAPGGGGDLPFTGPGDVLLALVIAMLAGTGGILFMMGATGREQLEGLNERSMDSPSGWHLAYRELRKQQLADED
jgi:hypothetical protein